MSKHLEQARQLLAAGRYGEAADLCRRSIKRQREVPAARRLLAACLYNQSVVFVAHANLPDAAEEALRAAIASDPEHADAHNNLGSLLVQTHRAEESLAHFERAVRLQPDNAVFLGNLAKAHEENDRLDAASLTLARLARLDRDNGDAYLMRDALLASPVAPDDAYIEGVRAGALRKLEALAARRDLRMSDPYRFPSTYFRFSYHGVSNVELNRRVAQIYLAACPGLAWRAPHVPAWRGPRGRIRVGIASRFLRVHSIGSTSRGLVEKLDRAKFEVIVVRLEPSSRDPVAQAIDRAADSVVELDPRDLAGARSAIAKLALDVLYYQDIGMEPLGYFLAFARLAPVQLTSFGHPDTTGIPNVDYYVSLEKYETDESDAHYTERLVRLPKAGTLAYYYRPAMPARRGRAHFGLPPERRIYCCPQMLFKVLPVMDRLFAAILEKDPAALFVLIEPIQRLMRVALERRIARHPGRLGDAVRFVPTRPHADYLALLAEADVILDTPHFNGYNTSLEAFAVGVPVVTLPGVMQRERHTLGMYLAMGFMELVAASEAQYVELACRVANDPAYRDHCRREIAARCPALFESLDYVRGTEDALAEMVDRAQPASGA